MKRRWVVLAAIAVVFVIGISWALNIRPPQKCFSAYGNEDRCQLRPPLDGFAYLIIEDGGQFQVPPEYPVGNGHGFVRVDTITGGMFDKDGNPVQLDLEPGQRAWALWATAKCAGNNLLPFCEVVESWEFVLLAEGEEAPAESLSEAPTAPMATPTLAPTPIPTPTPAPTPEITDTWETPQPTPYFDLDTIETWHEYRLQEEDYSIWDISWRCNYPAARIAQVNLEYAPLRGMQVQIGDDGQLWPTGEYIWTPCRLRTSSPATGSFGTVTSFSSSRETQVYIHEEWYAYQVQANEDLETIAHLCPYPDEPRLYSMNQQVAPPWGPGAIVIGSSTLLEGEWIWVPCLIEAALW